MHLIIISGVIIPPLRPENLMISQMEEENLRDSRGTGNVMEDSTDGFAETDAAGGITREQFHAMVCANHNLPNVVSL